MTNYLRVRNLAQKVLWEEELSGQISDGRWENSKPYDHWEYWHRNVEVIVDPEHAGRDFFVRRDGYCFTEKELLEIIGERMVNYVRVATGNPDYSEKDMIKDLRDLRKIIKISVSSDRPVPPQPIGRKNTSDRKGWDEPYTLYTPQPGACTCTAEDIGGQHLLPCVATFDCGSPRDYQTGRTYTMADFDLTK